MYNANLFDEVRPERLVLQDHEKSGLSNPHKNLGLIGLVLVTLVEINKKQGPVAQLVERCIRIAEARSSTLLRSRFFMIVVLPVAHTCSR